MGRGTSRAPSHPGRPCSVPVDSMTGSRATAQRCVGLLLVFTLPVAVAGCGGGDPGSRTKASQPTKAEFVKSASAICVAAHERTTEEFGRYVSENQIPRSGPAMAAKAADAFRVVFEPAIEKQIDALAELEPPKGGRGKVDAILAAMRQGLARARRQPLDFIQTSSTLRRASLLAVAYGLPACSANSSE